MTKLLMKLQFKWKEIQTKGIFFFYINKNSNTLDYGTNILY